MFLQKMQDNNVKKLRGRAAIEAAHGGISSEDETRLDMMISDLYLVAREEAADIHASYHAERIFLLLQKRAIKNNIERESLLQKMQYLDLPGAARDVAKGKLTEAAAVDALFRRLWNLESHDDIDRYINFYG